jgi:hypothetical protein
LEIKQILDKISNEPSAHAGDWGAENNDATRGLGPLLPYFALI